MPTICMSAFVSGCFGNVDGPLFCDVESARRFPQGELEARAPFRANLELDLATNERGREHCGWL
jgi:hypothetical protein